METSKRSHPEIPIGDYCYNACSSKSKLQFCPHFVGKDINGVRLPYCKLLKMGSVPAGSLNGEEKEKLIAAWGLSHISDDYVTEALKYGWHKTEEEARAFRTFETPKEFDLFMLWDHCKECGINIEQPGEIWARHGGKYEEPFVPTTYPNNIVELDVTATIPESCKDKRSFQVWTRIPKAWSPVKKIRYLVKFIRKLSRILERSCGITDGIIENGASRIRLQNPEGLVTFASTVVKSIAK